MTTPFTIAGVTVECWLAVDAPALVLPGKPAATLTLDVVVNGAVAYTAQIATSADRDEQTEASAMLANLANAATLTAAAALQALGGYRDEAAPPAAALIEDNDDWITCPRDGCGWRHRANHPCPGCVGVAAGDLEGGSTRTH